MSPEIDSQRSFWVEMQNFMKYLTVFKQNLNLNIYTSISFLLKLNYI